MKITRSRRTIETVVPLLAVILTAGCGTNQASTPSAPSVSAERQIATAEHVAITARGQGGWVDTIIVRCPSTTGAAFVCRAYLQIGDARNAMFVARDTWHAKQQNGRTIVKLQTPSAIARYVVADRDQSCSIGYRLIAAALSRTAAGPAELQQGMARADTALHPCGGHLISPSHAGD